MKGDDIDGYNDHFHELAEMYPTLVTPEYKKIEQKGYYKNKYPKRKDQQNKGAQGRAYVIRTEESQRNPNVITGTFLLNNHYARILFDSGVDKSFVSTTFSTLIDIAPSTIDISYEVELANGNVVSTNTISHGCTLNLLNQLFKIDLLPIELGSFDVVIGMDWLSKHHMVIMCGDKIVCIPYNNKILTIEGDRSKTQVSVISCIKARKYIERGCQLFLAHITEKKPTEKQLEDVPIVRDFPEVFPKDLPRIPPTRQVEFHIDLVPRATP
ncbi:putative reverse transcriptase domain-containing protein [Tanacetum coccineum]